MSDEYLIDSSLWIEYLAGSAKGIKVKNIIEEKSIATSILSIAELADKFEREEKDFSSFLTFIQSRAAIVPLNIALVLHAAKLKKRFRYKNNKFGLIDALHLATAQQEKLILVTADNDFKDAENIILIR